MKIIQFISIVTIAAILSFTCAKTQTETNEGLVMYLLTGGGTIGSLTSGTGTSTGTGSGTSTGTGISTATGSGTGTGTGTGSGSGSTTSLTLDSWTTGTLANGTEVDTFTFITSANTFYSVMWDDSWSGSGSYTADVKVTVTDNSSNILYDIQNSSNFNGLDSGYSTARVVSSPSATTYNVKVECFSGCSGTYRVKVRAIPTATLTSGASATTGTLGSTHLIVASGSFYAQSYTFSVTSGTTYTIKWGDLADKAGGDSWTQDITVYPYYMNSATTYLSVITLGSNDNGWTTPRTFTASQSGIVVLLVYPFNQGSFSTSVTGYSIQVY